MIEYALLFVSIAACICPLIYLLISLLTRLINPKGKSDDNNVHSITSAYRINRIIRSEWSADNCTKINSLNHYLVPIDGEMVKMGIIEIVSAIDSLNKHERQKGLK